MSFTKTCTNMAHFQYQENSADLKYIRLKFHYLNSFRSEDRVTSTDGQADRRTWLNRQKMLCWSTINYKKNLALTSIYDVSQSMPWKTSSLLYTHNLRWIFRGATKGITNLIYPIIVLTYILFKKFLFHNYIEKNWEFFLTLRGWNKGKSSSICRGSSVHLTVIITKNVILSYRSSSLSYRSPSFL